MTQQEPAIVIGGGLGGLASAIRLRAMGWPVIVLEAGDQPGGRARVFQQDGFTWDAGPTVVTAPYLLDELFTLVGRDPRERYQLLPVDPFYRVDFPDGSSFDYVGDEDRILDQIRVLSPQDVDGYRKLAAHAERIFDVGYTGLADQPFDKLSEMLRVVPDMVKLESYRSVYSLVSKYIKDDRLRQVFTFQPLLVGGNPFDTTSIYMLIHWLERKWGVWYAKGGTGALVRAMVDLLEELGAEVRLNSPVTEIEVEGGRAVAVRTEDGQRIPAGIVVSNADPSTVYSKLVAPQHRRTNTDRSINRKKQSMSLFVAYFGANRTWPELKHHTIVLGNRYEGLLDDIFHKKVLADDFSLYLHAPGRTDSSMAPPGMDSFYVLSPVPNQLSGVDWAEAGPAYLDAVLGHLDDRVLPGLRDSIVTKRTIDPRYFEGELRSRDGAAFGIEPTLTQSAWFRYHNRSEDVGGLYFVGASSHPGAGMPGVLCSAKVLERQVERPAHPVPLPLAAVRAAS
jgi:phytoene desaturase